MQGAWARMALIHESEDPAHFTLTNSLIAFKSGT